jgi:hypothetical protein
MMSLENKNLQDKEKQRLARKYLLQACRGLGPKIFAIQIGLGIVMAAPIIVGLYCGNGWGLLGVLISIGVWIFVGIKYWLYSTIRFVWSIIFMALLFFAIFESAKRFEEAGVARTERSIINWCQPNRQGISRLDCYFDPNERKYYITPQSVELAIAEEKAKADKTPVSEPVGNVRKDAEKPDTGDEVSELQNQIRDLEITNRAKDYFIGRLEKERDGFFEQLLTASRKMGELETKLLQIEGQKTQN